MSEKNITDSPAAPPVVACSDLFGVSIACQKPHIGSEWYRGNFSLGIMVDSHPRFVNVIFAFVVLEVVISWTPNDQAQRPPEL